MIYFFKKESKTFFARSNQNAHFSVHQEMINATCINTNYIYDLGMTFMVTGGIIPGANFRFGFRDFILGQID